jgi:NAD+ diphosphatase
LKFVFKEIDKVKISNQKVLALANNIVLTKSNQLPDISNIKIVKNATGFINNNLIALDLNSVSNASEFDKTSLRTALDFIDLNANGELLSAAQLVNWHMITKYCTQCGAELSLSVKEIAKACSSCQKNYYPTLNPVVIVLIQRGKELLLARGLPPKKHHSCLAGFVEPGETIEAAAAREVFEEVKIKIKNLKYFGSQTWPFPHNLMLGFTAEWESGEIQIDPSEISDAQWFSKENPPPVLPPKVSIARQMIDSFFA